MISQTRIQYIDIAKGIGIILVAVGHCPQIYAPLKSLIYAFHMPLFFIISGIVWDKASHEKKGYLTRNFVFGKIKRLILPCYIWGTIYLIISTVINHNKPSVLSFAYLLYGSHYGFISSGSLSSLWFLTCMFLTVCGFELVQMLLKNKKSKIPIVVLFVVFMFIGYVLPHYSVGYPWCLDVSFIAAAFMLLGNLARQIRQERERERA